MIDAARLLGALESGAVEFFAGVPDSTLKSFCRLLLETIPPERHVIAANEGSAIGLAAGYHLATGAIGCVYMQNSGLGNAVNPLTSLASREVYGIPILLLIGWRGEMIDGVQQVDEPQHAKQGRITLNLLDCLGIGHAVLDGADSDLDGSVSALLERARAESQPVALVVRRGLFDGGAGPAPVRTSHALTREEALRAALAVLPSDAVVVATTGQVSRELYEFRIASGCSPQRDFLTVGSMGHALQIASGVALARPDKRVVCIDGDGALIMHMGGMTTSAALPNLLHLVMNNGAHESAGGLPTRGFSIDMPAIARACGYANVARAANREEVSRAIERALSGSVSAFIEICTALGSRADLARPKGEPREAKKDFMRRLGATTVR